MDNDRASRNAALLAWAPVLLVAAAALHISSSMLGGDWFETHERIWYPVRLVEYVQAWKGGSIYPRWCPDLYGGFGYPFFNFYAPGLYTTAALFMVALGTSAVTALKIAIGLFTLVGGLGAYGLVRGETRRSDAALLGAMVYLYAPYHLNDLFMRGDLAEYAALAMAPFALWGYRALGRADEARAPLVGTLAAAAHAAVWLCHTITGLYITEVLALALAITAFTERRRAAGLRRTLLGGAVIVLALAMVSIYIVPAWLERPLVNLDNIHSGTFHPSKNLIGWRWPFQFGFFSLGLPLVAGFVASALSLALPGPRKNAAAIARWWMPPILLANLMFTWSEPIWNVLPLGEFIQFPWRLLGLISLFGAVGVGVTLANLVPAKWSAPRWAVCGALVLSVVYLENVYNRVEAFLPAARIPSTPEEIHKSLYNTVVADEYLPLTVKVPPTAPRSGSTVAVSGAPVLSTRRVTPLRYVIDVQAAQPSVVEVEVFDFPGWKVATDEGPAVPERAVSKSGLIRLTFLERGHYRVQVYFGLTAMRAAASLVSILALAFGYWLLKRAQRLLRPRSV